VEVVRSVGGDARRGADLLSGPMSTGMRAQANGSRQIGEV